MALTDISHPTDIAMLTDLYELTMAQGLWESGKANEQGCFTAFYRDHPFGSAYAVMCGTAKLPESERRGIPHHLLDVLDVTADAAVAWYQDAARTAVAEVHARGADAVLVSPVFPTASHPGGRTLGLLRFARLARASRLPVYALGGISAASQRRLKNLPIAGIAGISAVAGIRLPRRSPHRNPTRR